MPPPHPATLPPAELLAECRTQRLRRSGPGGQHRNKVETAVRLEHLPTGIRAEASERRSQAQNHAVALSRLRVQLALAVRSEPTKSTSPSPLWQSRSHGGKLAVSGEHEDFPALLAEALDALATADYELPPTSAALGVSTSQLGKFLKKEPAAWQQVNSEREQRGLPVLH